MCALFVVCALYAFVCACVCCIVHINAVYEPLLVCLLAWFFYEVKVFNDTAARICRKKTLISLCYTLLRLYWVTECDADIVNVACIEPRPGVFPSGMHVVVQQLTTRKDTTHRATINARCVTCQQHTTAHIRHT